MIQASNNFMNWRNCHFIVGAIGLLLFVVQGQYMAHVLVVPELPDGERMMYRTAHIYLMLASVINIARAYAMQPSESLNLLEVVCSVIILLSLPLLIVSFFAESGAGDFERPIAAYTLFGIIGAANGLLLCDIYCRVRSR